MESFSLNETSHLISWQAQIQSRCFDQQNNILQHVGGTDGTFVSGPQPHPEWSNLHVCILWKFRPECSQRIPGSILVRLYTEHNSDLKSNQKQFFFVCVSPLVFYFLRLIQQNVFMTPVINSEQSPHFLQHPFLCRCSPWSWDLGEAH